MTTTDTSVPREPDHLHIVNLFLVGGRIQDCLNFRVDHISSVRTESDVVSGCEGARDYSPVLVDSGVRYFQSLKIIRGPCEILEGTTHLSTSTLLKSTKEFAPALFDDVDPELWTTVPTVTRYSTSGWYV